MKRRWAYILIALAIALAMSWLVKSRGRLPSGLEDLADGYDVTVVRDQWGVPHVMGVTDADAAYGLAYAHAEDDFVTIQAALLAARGRLGTLLGGDGAPNDYMVALLKVGEVARAGYASLDSTTRALCDGYADGLNVYAARHPDEALRGLYPISGRDVVAGFVHKTPLFFGMDRILGELFAGQPEDSSETAQVGSNAFAVSPQRSADGSTLLAVNSHQPWSGPVAWYEAHMMSEEGLNMLGGTFPGSPVILHGHNDSLGWAHTVNAPDVVDLYRLTVNPENRNQYLLDGQWTDFEVGVARIPVRLIGLLEWTFERELLWSIHGPAVRTDSGAVALRVAGWGDAGQVTQWYAMNRARNLNEWRTAMARQAIPVFNTVYADGQGHIYYVYNARMPDRKQDLDWGDVLPGDESALVWHGYRPFDALPQVLDPAVGFVQNANSTPFQTTGTAADPVPSREWLRGGVEIGMTNRAQRALKLFSEDSSITWQDFAAIKYDMRYGTDSRASALVRQLRFAAVNDSLTRAAIRVVEAWDRGVEPENRQAALAVISLGPFLSGQGVVDSSRLQGRVREAATWLMEHHGTLEPAWEEVNRLRRGDVDIGLGGAPDVLHAVHGRRSEDGHLVGYQGDSYVLLVSFGADGRVHSESVHVFGSATSREGSPHFNDQSPLFARRELKAMPFYRDDVLASRESASRPGRR